MNAPREGGESDEYILVFELIVIEIQNLQTWKSVDPNIQQDQHTVFCISKIKIIKSKFLKITSNFKHTISIQYCTPVLVQMYILGRFSGVWRRVVVGFGVMFGLKLVHKTFIEDLCVGVDGRERVVHETRRDAARGRCGHLLLVRAPGGRGHWGGARGADCER